MSLFPTPPTYRAMTSCGDHEAECELSILQDTDGDYCVSLDGEQFPACLIPDLIEFLKIAQAWIDANKHSE